MQIYDYYIAPEDYERALKNGICRSTLEYRIHSLGWDREKAVNTPPRKRKRIAKHLVEEAQKNGIGYATLRYRLNIYGWDVTRAISEPVWDSEQYSRNSKNRKYPKEILELAHENNIPEGTFYHRIRRQGVDMITAVTRPIMTRKEVSRLGNEAYFNLYGRKFSSY
ncbi:hypothetical protein ACJDU8_01430 [Clostridium sp. WILCCON 0269]|uniref:Integrase n=1 Tax=Candidatus Clostridium eludens TaxID=3381663 RepID=A0ABW8SG87_9CLOT